jgi:integrase
MERAVLSPAEVEKLAQAMTQESDRVLVRLLAFGGLRINECFALQRSDVDLERKTLTVRQSVADVSGRLIVGPTKTSQRERSRCPMPSGRSYLISRIHSRL